MNDPTSYQRTFLAEFKPGSLNFEADVVALATRFECGAASARIGPASVRSRRWVPAGFGQWLGGMRKTAPGSKRCLELGDPAVRRSIVACQQSVSLSAVRNQQ